MRTPEWQLQKFIIGIRHQRTFMISDIHGDIVDRVIALSKQNPFPKDGFTKISRPDISAIILTNNDENISVNCNIDGIILTADMSGYSPHSTDKIQQMFIRIVNEIVPLTQAGDKVNRVGVVYEFHIPQFTNSAKAAFSQFMQVSLQGTPDTVLMRVSLKNPIQESLIRPDKINDYQNVILTISSEREKEGEEDEVEDAGEEEKKERIPTILKITADCQIYYVPQRHIKHINIDGHLSNAKSFIESTIKKIPLNIE